MSAPLNAPASGPLAPGAVLAHRLVIERLVGEGGMGAVYSARHELLGTTVAVKVLNAANSTPEKRRRFLGEGRAAATIAHPNIVRVTDVFEDEHVGPILVMELLAGESLRALLQREGRLALPVAAAILVPVARALDAAHRVGIIHRDVKPENIFLAEEPGGARVPKVLDFGIAKVLEAEVGSESAETASGAILGTLQYMSYEQAMGERDVDRRTDIWSIGVVLYELLAGHRPIRGESLGQIFKSLLSGEIEPIRAQVPDLPLDVAEVIDRCLQRERSDRLGELAELIEILSRYAAPSGVETTASTLAVVSVASPNPAPGRRRAAFAVAALLGLGLTASFVVIGLRAHPSTRESGGEIVVGRGAATPPPTASSAAAAVEPSVEPPVAVVSAPPPAAPGSVVGARPISSAQRHSRAGSSSSAPTPSASSTGPTEGPPPRLGIPTRLPY